MQYVFFKKKYNTASKLQCGLGQNRQIPQKLGRVWRAGCTTCSPNNFVGGELLPLSLLFPRLWVCICVVVLDLSLLGVKVVVVVEPGV